MPSLILLALALLAPAAAASKAEVVAGLQAWLDGTKTLELRFRQSLVSGALGTTVAEDGRLYLERPGKMRWDYLEPERKIAMLLGDRTILYLEEERTMSRGRLTAEQGLFPKLLAGGSRVEEHFDATLVATPTAGGRGAYRLRLVPKADPSAGSSVTLTLRPPAFSIEGAELLDETGNRTTYTFTDVKRNRAFPGAVFGFEPPPGTEIVDER
jgi:outer membrane lipoprotein carrier protein